MPSSLHTLDLLLQDRARRGDVIGVAAVTANAANDYHQQFQRWISVGTLVVGIGVLVINWRNLHHSVVEREHRDEA